MRKALLVLIWLQLFVEEPLAWFLSDSWEAANSIPMILIYEMLPTLLQTSFTTIAVFCALRERTTDLVETRSYFRLIMIFLMAFQSYLSLYIERVAFQLGVFPLHLLYPVHMTLVVMQVLISLVLVLWVLRRDLLDFLNPQPADAQPVQELPSG